MLAFSAQPALRRHRSGLIPTSTIPNNPWRQFLGSKPRNTANGSARRPYAPTACPRKPNGNWPPAAAWNRKISPGATPRRNPFPTTPHAGRPALSQSRATLPTSSVCTIFVTTSTNGAATGTTRTITAFRRRATRAGPRPPSANLLAVDPGDITLKRPAAPPVPASPQTFSTPTTAFA